MAVVATALGVTLPALACSVPVFRYALDHWQSDSYRLEVAPDAAKDETITRFLRNFGANSPLNMVAARLPASAPNPTSRLTFPHGQEKGLPDIWSGALDPAMLGKLTNSPARRELVRRILDGESAVMILVETSDRQTSEAAASRVTKRLSFLESAAVPPAIDPNDPDSQLGPGPALRVKFSLMRVKADDPAEAPFLAMLAGPKHVTPEAGPLLAVAFGRGRVLGTWPAKDMEAEQIDEACMFLLGACSCQAKALNPGWDLLLAVDWDAELQDVARKTAPAAAALPDAPKPPAPPAPETVTIKGTSEIAPAPKTSAAQTTTPVSKFLVFAATFAVAFAGASIVWRRAQAKS